ncbi:MAG TPA: c-type cytochrome [Polyangiales bacterium]
MRVNMPSWGMLLCLGLWGCSDDGDDNKEMSEDNAFTAQAARGQRLYAEHCAECHGLSGQGNTAPRLVGLDEGALPLEPPASRNVRDTEFVTAGDVAEFVVANMPPGKGGSLSADEYLAILAFDLKANGVMLEGELDLERAGSLTIPR